MTHIPKYPNLHFIFSVGTENGNNTNCPDGYGTYRSKTNCGAFYVCVAGSPVDFICPGGTNYNDVCN